MKTLFKKKKRVIEDFISYNPLSRSCLGRMVSWREGLRTPGTHQGRARAIAQLCAASRYQTALSTRLKLQKRIDRHLGELDVAAVDWTEWVPDFEKRQIFKGALLKPYIGPLEKGVLYIAFEQEWFKLIAAANRAELASRYDLVLASSGDPHNVLNHVFAKVWPAPLYCQLSNPGDKVTLPAISPNIKVVDLYASSWVNPSWYRPVSRKDRKYDLTMVANFAKFKRHFSLFEAIQKLPVGTRILLIGQNELNRTAQSIREEASWYGVADRITIQEDLSHDDVMAALSQSRASVILSRREGSCVVVVESMLCDTPVALLEGCEIGSAVFINEHTGRLLSPGRLGTELAAFIEEADQYNPRAWALKHITNTISSAKLNDALRQAALAAGRQWTVDIAALQRDPAPLVAEPTARQALEPARLELEARSNMKFGRPAALVLAGSA